MPVNHHTSRPGLPPHPAGRDKGGPALRAGGPGSPRARLLFALTFFKHPRMLGSVVPSSRFLRDRLLDHVDWNSVRTIVEYGPGVGTLTCRMLERMRGDAVLVAIESSREFVRFLGATVRDPRLRLVHSSAAEIRSVLAGLGLPAADCIISGIPYSMLDPAERSRILRDSHAVLRPNGLMLAYQFTATVRRHLEREFGPVHQELQPLNLLPARIFVCRRNGSGTVIADVSNPICDPR